MKSRNIEYFYLEKFYRFTFSYLLTSVNPFTGLQYEHLRLGLSYDMNTTKIGKTGGVYELSLTYQFNLDKKCFGCPNYTGR